MIADREKCNWNILAEELSNLIKSCTPETAVMVDVCDGLTGCNGVDITPADTNVHNFICCLEGVVDFVRCKGLSCWTDALGGKVRIHIY